MDKLIAELMRLFVPAGTLSPELLARRALGQAPQTLDLTTPDGQTRAIAVAFDKGGDSGEAGHWTRLCAAAKALQTEHGFPAPAVSVSGGRGYTLWIALEAPVPAAQAQAFARLLRRSYFPELAADAPDEATALPPCLDPGSGRWAAFIHPGMGASFAEEPWLEMAPPPLAQAAFLEEVGCVGPALFARALAALQPAAVASAVEAAPGARPAEASRALLLSEATLEDIVRHLHARNIEPTFRHLLPDPER
ncbi:hypothetical protein ACFPOU_15545 [Massilia jejuensis]|uniref:Uncharacterized protein n=1 Tax=Massilia jejuensis TaxID=648894 RepID=A0ABW0PJI6_9BURK